MDHVDKDQPSEKSRSREEGQQSAEDKPTNGVNQPPATVSEVKATASASDVSSDHPSQSAVEDEEGEKDPGDASSGAIASETAAAASQSRSTNHVFNESWSKLPRDVIIDKIKGVIYGHAIGDAFGLSTEFLISKEAKKYYKGGPKSYDDIIPDMHRQRWKKGDWTDDTDQMLLVLQMIVERNGQVDALDFANRIHTWMREGFKELGDIGGMGIGMTTKKVLTHPEFLRDPQACAREVWEASRRYLAANGAVMRTSVLGVLNFNDIAKVATNTAEIARTTHADPRCIASCVAVTTAIAMILKGDYDPSKKSGLKQLMEAALKEAENFLEDKDHKKELHEHATAKLKDLKLDENKKIGYTYKAFGAGFYGLRKTSKKKSFRDVILKVIMEAGDADSNGAVCGGLAGCVVGFKALPEDLLQFPHRTWLDQQVDNFLTTIGLNY